MHWVFGYGSLIYKVDFPVLESQPGYIVGWERRFWQGSHDHRGTPEDPGRVVTLVSSPGTHCAGVAYCITEEVFEHLDFREKNGYQRIDTPIHLADGREIPGEVYVAEPGNFAYLGPDSATAIAAQIARSHGPSGSNRDYLLTLAHALRELGIDDDHVFELELLVTEAEVP